MKLAIVTTTMAASAVAQFDDGPTGAWPAFGIRSDHPSRSKYTIPVDAAPSLVWSRGTDPAPIVAQILIDMDNATYAATGQGNIVKHSGAGEEIWKWEGVSSSPIVGTPTVIGRGGDGSDGGGWEDTDSVYFGTLEGEFIVLHALNGTLRHEPWQAAGPITSAAIIRNHIATAIGNQPGSTTAYFGAGSTLTALSVRTSPPELRYVLPFPEGTTFESPTYGFCTLVATASDGTVTNINPHRFPGYPNYPEPICQGFPEIKYTYQAQAAGRVSYNTGAGGQGPVLVATEAGTVEQIDGDGTNMWTYDNPTGAAFLSSPSGLGVEGTVYFGTILAAAEDGVLYALNQTGGLVWSLDVGGRLDSSPAIGSDGNVFLASGSDVHAISSDGELLATYNHGEEITNSPSLSANGEVVFGDLAGNVNVVRFSDAEYV